MRRLAELLKVTGISIAIAVLAILAAEIGVRIVEALGDSTPPAIRAVAGPGVHPIIERQEWGPEYLENLRDFHWQHHYDPYVGFRSTPHTSSLVNVGPSGLRETQFNSADPSARLVYACGGSTMIGIGVPDWGTIPSYLARELNAGGAETPVRVVNRGQAWWTSGQGLMDLIVALRSGERPDVVIFYDGINDFSVVSYGGTPGGIAPYAVRMLDRGLTRLWKWDEPGPFDSLRLPIFLRRTLGLSAAPDPNGVSQRTGERVPPKGDLPSRVREAAALYEANVRVVRTLGEAYGFESYFFLEPFPLISPRPLTPEEEPVVRDLLHPWERELAEEFYEQLRRSAYLRSLPEYVDVSAALDGVDETILLDAEHLLPRGNEIAARAIVRELQRMHAPFLVADPGEREGGD